LSWLELLPIWGALLLGAGTLIARRTLRGFLGKARPPGSSSPPGVVREASKADWATAGRHHSSTGTRRIVGNSRVVFHVGGNKNRLVVAFKYEARIGSSSSWARKCRIRSNRRGEGVAMDISRFGPRRSQDGARRGRAPVGGEAQYSGARSPRGACHADEA